MTTVRLRGIYAAALTQLFLQHGPPWEVVQPTPEVRARLDYPWRADSPDVDIDDEPDARGYREVIRVAGMAEAVDPALELIRSRCFDVIVHREPWQIGAIYLGVVGLRSRARRQAIVYLGDGLEGLLPLRQDEPEVPVGARVPVRITAIPKEGDERPQVSTILTVPGHYAVLTTAPGIKVSKQITDPALRQRLQQLGASVPTDGWGIIWRTAAEHAEEPVLVAELQALCQKARALQERIRQATQLGCVQSGELVAHVCMPGHAKAVCDQLRAALLPTLPGHHKYKARGDAYGTVVDALEKELSADELQARTASLRVLASLDTMQQPFQHTLQVMARGLNGALSELGRGQCAGYDLDAGWVDVRRALGKHDYPQGLRLDKKPGDYSVTRYQEGSWSFVTRFYGRNGTWKGDYAMVTTPIAIFSDQVQVFDLHVTVLRSPRQEPQVHGLEALRQLQQQGIVSAALVQRVEEEGIALIRQLREATPSPSAS
ncbi:MAG: RNA-binding protein [Candidatus Tectimicrobiota bacterium]|nr:MAG: RNA-binding protein [Candidatus Tectomicrobia bacterium]